MNIGSNDKRSNQRSLSIQQLNSKKLLNKIYTIDTKKKQKFQSSSAKRSLSVLDRNREKKLSQCNIKNLKSNLIPKFRGCGPGGINSSLMAKTITESRRSSIQNNDQSPESLQDKQDQNNDQILIKQQFYYQKIDDEDSHNKINNQKSNQNILHARKIENYDRRTDNSAESIRKMLDIKYNNQNLKNARQITTKLNNESPNRLQRSTSQQKQSLERKNLFLKDSYDLFPQKLNQQNDLSVNAKLFSEIDLLEKGYQDRCQYQNDVNEIKRQQQTIQKTINPFKTGTLKDQASSQITEVSPAVVQFSKDFDLMRIKFSQMANEMREYQNTIQDLKNEVQLIRNENICLNSDIKCLKKEHNEVLHQVHKLDLINNDLVKENVKLKDILYQQNVDRNRQGEVKRQNIMTQYSPIRIKHHSNDRSSIQKDDKTSQVYIQDQESRHLSSQKLNINDCVQTRNLSKIDVSDKENLDENQSNTNRVFSQLNQDFEHNMYPSYVIQKHRTKNAHFDGPPFQRQNQSSLPEKIHEGHQSNQIVQQSRKEPFLSEMKNLSKEMDIKSLKSQQDQKRLNEMDSIYKKSSPIYSLPITVKSQELQNHGSINEGDKNQQNINNKSTLDEDQNQQLSDWVIERIRYKDKSSILQRRFKV